jgi:hypothetical protein
LDEQLQLPRRSFSHPLQQRLVRFAVQGPFDEAIDNVERATSVKLSKRSAEQIVKEAAVDFEGAVAPFEQNPGKSKAEREERDFSPVGKSEEGWKKEALSQRKALPQAGCHQP